MTRIDQFFDIERFQLVNGQTLPVRQSYITQGSLNSRADNVILMLHGYTSSHRFILPPQGTPSDGGSWSELVGPGKPIDTEQYFVVSPNALGSSYGSTGPASIDLKTGAPYGPNFPNLHFADIVHAQKALLEHLGVATMHAIIGFSMGGYLAFQWATQHPKAMRKVVAALTAPWSKSDDSRSQIRQVLEKSPNWNEGWYYDKPCAMTEVMKAIRLQTLKNFKVQRWLTDRGLSQKDADEQLDSMAGHWAREFDPNALITLRRLINSFDVREQLSAIQAQLLYVLSRTDALFPPSIAHETLDRIQQSPVQYIELDSEYGHFAAGLDHQKWALALTHFLHETA